MDLSTCLSAYILVLKMTAFRIMLELMQVGEENRSDTFPMEYSIHFMARMGFQSVEFKTVLLSPVLVVCVCGLFLVFCFIFVTG